MDQEETKQQYADSIESPDEFLANLGKALRDKNDFDIDLADILATHLLTVAPTGDAVSKARAAILKLAGNRAIPPVPEVDNG